MSTQSTVYGSLLIVRPPVPATVNKAGANYKSEVTHLEYSPRRAYDEWLTICDGILACGGDALFEYEAADEPFLDIGNLEVDGDGNICAAGSKEVIGDLRSVMTGRVFTANGPWVVCDETRLRAVMPHMLEHRLAEAPYYRGLLAEIAEAGEYDLAIAENPHRWEGMADVAVVGDKVVLTYAVSGHYDEGLAPKSSRSSRKGVEFAADAVGVTAEDRIFAELVYPHFHGDTVHYGARPTGGEPVLVHYPKGLWREESSRVSEALGAQAIVTIGADDAVEQYAGNSRQVLDGVLIPDGASAEYEASLDALGLKSVRVPLFELFGKAGGGPACATLYLPSNLRVPEDAPFRYSNRKQLAVKRRMRLPERLTVAPEYFEGKDRG